DHAPDLAALLKSLDPDLHLTRDGLPTGALGLVLQSVDSGFQSLQGNSGSFPLLHVEPLLDQASDLLDRGIKERSQWAELSAKALDAVLELYEFIELDRIHRNEEKEGLYDIPWLQSAAEFWALRVADVTSSRAAAALTDQLWVIPPNTVGWLSPQGIGL